MSNYQTTYCTHKNIRAKNTFFSKHMLVTYIKDTAMPHLKVITFSCPSYECSKGGGKSKNHIARKL
jgi:hypothetical protein